jgi:glycosyltransferase involved in cell wall biosynthesis
MTTGRRYDICACVISDLEFDARVWKEARSLAADGHAVVVIGPVFDIERARRRRDPSGIDVLEVPFGYRDRGKSLRRRALALTLVMFEVLRTRARTYHAHDIHVTPAAWLASRRRGARLVYDAHELWGEPEVAGLRNRIAAWVTGLLERLMLRASDAVVTTNESRAAALKQRYGRADITVLANVPLLEREVEAQPEGLPPGKRVVLYVGRISTDGRAFRDTVQALPELDDDVDLVFLGFGWEFARERIRGYAREACVEDRVHFLPPRPFDQLIGTAAAATVGLVPIHGYPLTNRLGDTNKLHEYLMGGLPVAASDLPEIRSVVMLGNPRVGELFDPSSPKSIAHAIRTVIEDPRYEERRAEARKLAKERFNWEIEEGKLLRLYDEILGTARGGRVDVGLERA